VGFPVCRKERNLLWFCLKQNRKKLEIPQSGIHCEAMTNRRLLERKILFDWKKPWDILESFLGNSRFSSRTGRHRRPEKYFENTKCPLWGDLGSRNRNVLTIPRVKSLPK